MPLTARAERPLRELDRSIAEARRSIASIPARALRAPLAAVGAEETWSSMRLSGTPLDLAETSALLKRGVALGGYPLDAYIRVADYADAAQFVRELPTITRRRGFLTFEEVVSLHAIATRRSGPRPGKLRETTLPPFPGGMIVSPAWLIPQALSALVDRLNAGPPPDASTLVWVAEAHARYERIHPFPDANGRVGRLLINLLLKRCGYLPCVFRPRDAAPYLAALREADSRNIAPLALLIGRSLLRSYAFLGTSVPDADEAKPLSEFASGTRLAALYKAAQRGRLRAFRRDGRLMTTERWIAAYG